ncbi:hypothetical protein A4X03_0g9801 [Tilletia caries]|uniref:Uncharacterized protein n=1 Tax=Tilletia caries TaxID=13290 RepID=A0A8T8S994_9BASI|nr:hypothetical protein A4X03_0g9801 [Tilletia caries]
MSEDIEWLRSKGLLHLLIANGRDPRSALDQLRTGLLNGYIRAKAIHAVLTKPWPAKMGDGYVLRDVDVPAGLWAGLAHNSEIDLSEDVFWSNSQATATGFHTIRLTGLLFAKHDVLGFLDLSDAAPPKTSEARLSRADDGTQHERPPAGDGVVDLADVDSDVAASITAQAATAAAVRACRTWLTELYQTEKPGLPSRDAAKQQAFEKWPDGRMSGRQFLLLYQELSKERPWMSRRGPKPKSSGDN